MNPPSHPPASPSISRPLPPGLDLVLRAIDPEDWKKIEITVCRTPGTRQMVYVARFMDELLQEIGNAAFWVGSNRVTGPEIEAFHDRWTKALSELVSIGVEVARRMNRVEVFQRHKKVLVNFGHSGVAEPKPPKGKVAKPAPGPKAGAPATAMA